MIENLIIIFFILSFIINIFLVYKIIEQNKKMKKIKNELPKSILVKERINKTSELDELKKKLDRY